MFRDEKLELRVGLFIGLAMFLLFLIVFSISDLYVFEKGYNISVVFDYVNGLTENAPARLAGVSIGEVKGIKVFKEEDTFKTRVLVDVWVKGTAKIEEDAVARINTLGLLGEQYLEITPGTSQNYLTDKGKIIGKNPVNMGEQVESVTEFVKSASKIAKEISEGEGTLGKLLTQDEIYEDWKIIFGRLKDGEGTVGKLLTEEKIYNDLESFVADIKAHPWKLLSKPREEKTDEDKDKGRGVTVSPRR